MTRTEGRAATVMTTGASKSGRRVGRRWYAALLDRLSRRDPLFSVEVNGEDCVLPSSDSPRPFSLAALRVVRAGSREEAMEHALSLVRAELVSRLGREAEGLRLWPGAIERLQKRFMLRRPKGILFYWPKEEGPKRS